MKNSVSSDNCFKMLRKVDLILKQKSIDYWLDQGTLLGLTREGDLIEWDWDIDLSAKFENTKQIIDLVSYIQSNGFFAKYIEKSHAIRLEPKDKYFGWRHIDIHFHQLHDDAYTTFFYEFDDQSIRQSLLMWFVVKFDWIERKLGKSMPSRRQVFFDPDTNWTLQQSPPRNKFRGAIARVAYRIKNTFYNFRLRYFCTYVEVNTPAKWFDQFEQLAIGEGQYAVPIKKEEYLAFKYGENWQQPVKDYDWHNDGAVKNDSD
ncbi:LicD family protein [Paraglaciecola polaris]|uniref:LicD family protein n=1 Tax=Paraglaciecola polaris TaxID=222814 RepID=UPI0030EC3900